MIHIPKFDLGQVQTHALQIMDSSFRIPEMLVLNTEYRALSYQGHS